MQKMLPSSTPPPDARHPPVRRLKLVMNTSPTQVETNLPGDVIKEESSSPVRPSYSPVTPTLSHATLAREDAPQSEWIDERPTLPVSLDDNPDAIALRATISLLQMQRQQSLRDIRKLDKMKQEALQDPEAFVRDLRSGRLQSQPTGGITFDNDEEDVDDHDDDDDDNDDGSGVTDGNQSHVAKDQSSFGKLPTAQNVARCPPIEWSKYHIVGDSLDRLHELQREYPGLTEEALARGEQLRPHEIAAPYRPFSDRLESRPSSHEGRRYGK